jgi:hypothetical protein
MDFKRDRWGRPLIQQTDGKEIAYTRISGYGQVLENQFGLNKWKQRMALVGAIERPDLMKLATAAKGDDRKLDQLVEQMLEAGGASRAANTGTAIHDMLAQLDTGAITLDQVPDEFLAHARLWQDTITAHGFEIDSELVECQLVNDRFQAAGSGDNFLRDANGVLYVADKKTGKQIGNRPLAYMVQLALYATAERYDIETGQRTPLGCNLERGYIVHLPASGTACDLYEVDLQAAIELAELAQQVRRAEKQATPVVKLDLNPKPTTAKAKKPSVAERRQWIEDRVRTLLTLPDGPAMLQLSWPADVPRLSSGHKHTAAQLDQIASALDEAEKGASAPFPASDPADIAQPVVEAKGEPRNGQGNKPKPIAEGDQVDQPTIDALRTKIDSLLPDQKAHIMRWAKEAHEAGRSVSLQALASVRRFEIARAMIELATTWDGDPEAVPAVIRTITPMDTTVGATLGSLTIAQATSLVVHSEALSRYGTLSYTLDGVAEFPNIQEALATMKAEAINV